MDDYMKNCPSGKRLLGLLIDLYAYQVGVKVKYVITDVAEEKDRKEITEQDAL